MKDTKIPVPRVLLLAKEQAAHQKDAESNPWDQGHWANRTTGPTK